MTIYERIIDAIVNFSCETDSIDKIIALAYFIGREDAIKEYANKVNAVFSEQKKKANDCRYSNMAMRAQDMTTSRK